MPDLVQCREFFEKKARSSISWSVKENEIVTKVEDQDIPF
jgi:hypothetical protein